MFLGYVLFREVYHEQGVVRQAAATHCSLWRGSSWCCSRGEQLLRQRAPVCNDFVFSLRLSSCSTNDLWDYQGGALKQQVAAFWSFDLLTLKGSVVTCLKYEMAAEGIWIPLGKCR